MTLRVNFGYPPYYAGTRSGLAQFDDADYDDEKFWDRQLEHEENEMIREHMRIENGGMLTKNFNQIIGKRALKLDDKNKKTAAVVEEVSVSESEVSVSDINGSSGPDYYYYDSERSERSETSGDDEEDDDDGDDVEMVDDEEHDGSSPIVEINPSDSISNNASAGSGSRSESIDEVVLTSSPGNSTNNAVLSTVTEHLRNELSNLASSE